MRSLSLLLILFASIPFIPSGLQGKQALPPDDETVAADVGTFIPLEDGRRLQLFREENRIFARFVDHENVILEGDAESILFIIDDIHHREDKWRAVLKPLDETFLYSSPRRLYGPPTFRARIIIRFSDREPSSFTNVDLDLQSSS